MSHGKEIPYGSWPTPLTAEVVLASATGLGGVAVDGEDILWSETRPEEAGRVQLVRRSASGETTELLPDGFSARTRVHEYGGAAWWTRGGVLWFANWSDQRLCRIGADGAGPIALTPEPQAPAGDRYADGDLRPDGAELVCIREHHPPDGRGAIDVVNEIVTLDPRLPATPTPTVTGPDFVAHPRFSPDSRRLCWIEWDHPNMPWDGTRLKVRLLDGGAETTVAGGPEESVLEPAWQADGSLVFISDRSGWWNLYRWDPVKDRIETLVKTDADIGLPPWSLSGARYVTLPDGRIVYAASRDGRDRLAVRRRDGTSVDVATPFSVIDDLQVAGEHEVVAIAASPVAESAIVRIRLDGEPPWIETLRPPRDLSRYGVAPGYLSQPEAIEFPTAGEHRAHALFYAPVNPDVAPPADELPPLLVMIHGGPTAQAHPALQLGIQYWTTRGFAVVDVDYRGSNSYGREYRNLLRGSWGVADVEDCIAAAWYLAREGRVDPGRMCISGGSAGGFTVLAALARADTPFAAGADSFGIADLEVLARDTHKFESRYLDRLIGPYPEQRERYVERSPIHHLDELRRPLIVLHGREDAVVPLSQSEMIVSALRANGAPVAYLVFDGEQHGFRQGPNIRRALEAELGFYAQVFGFELPPAERIVPVEIENLIRS
ncbi:MAG TPA: S9 family peptidase [Solirubrobacteraceae bacterium]|nr:S9 family peptidase [Solirubrobacteraceae bacterium]